MIILERQKGKRSKKDPKDPKMLPSSLFVLLQLPLCMSSVSFNSHMTGFLVCEKGQKRRVRLQPFMPNIGNNEAKLFTIDGSPNAILKIPKILGFRTNLNRPWIKDEVKYSPPLVANNFLSSVVPTAFICSWLHIQFTSCSVEVKVLLKLRVQGFDMEHIPSSLVEPQSIRDARKGALLHQRLRAFLADLAKYEYQNIDHSLFDVAPSNIMYGTLNIDIDTIFTSNALLDSKLHLTISEEQIWLVDFTVHHHDHTPFFRPDYIWNDRQNSMLWARIDFPKSQGGGMSFFLYFLEERSIKEQVSFSGYTYTEIIDFSHEAI